MKFYKILTDSENLGQVINTGEVGSELDSKNLYRKFQFDKIKSLYLDTNFEKTDILKSGDESKGLIVSHHFYDLIKYFNLYDIQFTQISNNGFENYKFMFFNSDLTEKVDYEKSKFKLYNFNIISSEFEELDLSIPNNRNAVIKTDIDIVSNSAMKKISPSKGYKFIDGFNIVDLDVFRIGHYDLNFYISERVKVVLEKKSITGCKFIEQKLLEN